MKKSYFIKVFTACGELRSPQKYTYRKIYIIAIKTLEYCSILKIYLDRMSLFVMHPLICVSLFYTYRKFGKVEGTPEHQTHILNGHCISVRVLYTRAEEENRIKEKRKKRKKKRECTAYMWYHASSSS